MDLRQIEYVEAIARHSNFTRAAAEIHVAQPALSATVRRLEDQLGVRLFDRTSRRVTLTDAGRAFLARARRVTAEVTLLEQEMREYSGGVRGTLRASCWYHIDPDVVDFLRDFTAANPLVDVSIVEAPTPDSLDCLRKGELDAATIVMTPGLDLSEIEHVVARTEPFVLVTPLDHALAGREWVEPAEIVNERFIAAHQGTALRRCFERGLGGLGESPHIVIETNEVAATVTYVSIGLGSAILTPSIARPIQVPVALTPIRGVLPFVSAVAWHRGPHTLIAQRAIETASRLAKSARAASLGTTSAQGPSAA
jgi:LysR family transcriptional activator of glutamate synthase operon